MQNLKPPPKMPQGPQVMMHIWIEEIKEPHRILLRVEDGTDRTFAQTVMAFQNFIGKVHMVKLGELEVMPSGAIEAKVDL
jgi:hypothetical protein